MHGLSGDRRDRGDRRRLPRLPASGRCPLRSNNSDQARGASCVPASLLVGRTPIMPREGAHTGCISTQMLIDAGASLTIVGHSERREAQHESDKDVKAKARSVALRAGLGRGSSVSAKSLRCASGAKRSPPSSLPTRQVASGPPSTPSGNLRSHTNLVWAIGTGKIPTLSRDRGNARRRSAAASSTASDEKAKAVQILYGGSVKASNAPEILFSSGRQRRIGWRREPYED